MEIKKSLTIPYYEPNNNLLYNIKHSSNKRRINILKFIIKKLCNYFLEILAYNCPINQLRVFFYFLRGVSISKGVMIGLRCTLDHAFPEYIYLEDNCALAGNVYILTHSNPYKHFKGKLLSYVAPVIIREGAWVGVNVTILPGIEIGKYSIVAAGSVVTESVPNNVIVSGNPAKVIRKLDET